ncbi:MAG TPA: fused MFS/spermidine synthase, partial [Lachnospiraceae bacterium]|nr:fused MFS/spermidine synthase [Lachnospiraceae bacterium]
QTVTYDGRAYLQATDQKYDVIMVDAYQDITIPFQMSTTEFFSLVKEHLKKNGVMVVNMNMQTDDPDNINEYLSDTIAGVFDSVYTADVANNTNRELFASDNPQMLNVFEEQLANLQEPDLKKFLAGIGPSITVYEKGEHILTDDKAPVELLGMQVIDSIIEDEVGYYKEKFREGDLDSLLKEVL